VVAGPQGASYLPALTRAFSAAYPEITVELTQAGGSDQAARVLAEQQAGQYLNDVGISSPGDGFQTLQPANALDPLTDYLEADTTADEAWTGGWDAGWMDETQQFVYAYVATVDPTVFVDRNQIPESDLSTADDLLKPEFSGRIAMSDPRLGRAGTQRLGLVLAEKGEEYVTRLLVDQAPVLTGDNRQLAEWIARGTYPIAFAVANDQLATLRAAGVPIDQIEALSGDPIFSQYGHAGGGTVWAFTQAPHPNAARVYINFLLSQQGQASFACETIIYNSRRTDVPPVSPETLPDPDATYTDVQKQGSDQFPTQAMELAIQLLGAP
jgi:iron(III) transport system substrate-binding protein